MRVRLTRDEFAAAIRKGLDNQDHTTHELAGFVVGFASAHFAYEGQSLDAWLDLCRKAYENSHAIGIERGLIGAPD